MLRFSSYPSPFVSSLPLPLQWPKGVCGCPGGRKKKPLTAAYEEMVHLKLPDELRKVKIGKVEFELKRGSTFAHSTKFLAASKRGKRHQPRRLRIEAKDVCQFRSRSAGPTCSMFCRLPSWNILRPQANYRLTANSRVCWNQVSRAAPAPQANRNALRGPESSPRDYACHTQCFRFPEGEGAAAAGCRQGCGAGLMTMDESESNSNGASGETNGAEQPASVEPSTRAQRGALRASWGATRG